MSQDVGPNEDEAFDILRSLVSALGHPEFTDLFLAHSARLTGADQIVSFAMNSGSSRCLIAHRRDGEALVGNLCRRYLREYMDRDSFLLKSLSAAADYTSSLIDSLTIRDADYRQRLFADVGLDGKFAVTSRGNRFSLYLNFYFRDFHSARAREGVNRARRIAPLLTELLRKHEMLHGSSGVVDTEKSGLERSLAKRLSVLSTRETQVCARILRGLSSEAIAGELGIRIPTVKTFRQRAYEKLSISNQRQLFARCADLMM
jgi:DNA-binding CsgD family transcriptional regulator